MKDEAADNPYPLFCIALDLEREGFRLFTELSQMTWDPTGRSMFLSLAQEERKHIQAIERELSAWTARGAAGPPAITAEARAYRAQLDEIVAGIKGGARGQVTRETDQVAALRVAARMEDFLCGFYARAIDACGSQRAKEFFLHMLEMERGHRETLEGSISYLEDPENWYADRERQFEAR